jgi:hypothetical protein
MYTNLVRCPRNKLTMRRQYYCSSEMMKAAASNLVTLTSVRRSLGRIWSTSAKPGINQKE